MDAAYLHYIFEALLAIGMFIMQQSQKKSAEDRNNLNMRLTKIENDVVHTQLNYVQKSDFAEFKKELWQRFDNLERLVQK